MAGFGGGGNVERRNSAAVDAHRGNNVEFVRCLDAESKTT